jgi:hypothetical protein
MAILELYRTTDPIFYVLMIEKDDRRVYRVSKGMFDARRASSGNNADFVTVLFV